MCVGYNSVAPTSAVGVTRKIKDTKGVKASFASQAGRRNGREKKKVWLNVDRDASCKPCGYTPDYSRAQGSLSSPCSLKFGDSARQLATLVGSNHLAHGLSMLDAASSFHR